MGIVTKVSSEFLIAQSYSSLQRFTLLCGFLFPRSLFLLLIRFRWSFLLLFLIPLLFIRHEKYPTFQTARKYARD